jgi:hypothetical protein
MNRNRTLEMATPTVLSFVVAWLPWLAGACSSNGTVNDVDAPCLDQTCSGHGVCAVVGGDTAICICDAGYHETDGGLSCEADVVGDECNGVSCSGHGSCVVVQGNPNYPLCICDEGYHVVGKTNCVADETSADPCAGITCSGHGQCAVIGGTQAVCFCDDGYHVEDNVKCVLDTGPSADNWTRIADSAETIYYLSPDGIKAIYNLPGDNTMTRKLSFWHRTKDENFFLDQQLDNGRMSPSITFFTEDSKYAILAKGCSEGFVGMSVNLDTKEMVTFPAPCFPKDYVDQSRVVCLNNTLGVGAHGEVRIYNLETKAVTKVADLWGQAVYVRIVQGGAGPYIVTHSELSGLGTHLAIYRVSDHAKTQEIAFAETFRQPFVHGISSDGWIIYGQVDTSGYNTPYVLYRASVTGGAPAQLLPGDGLFLEASVYGTSVIVRRPNLSPVIANADGSGTPAELSAIPSTDYKFSFFDDTTVLFYRKNGSANDLMMAKAPDWTPTHLADNVTSHEVKGGKVFVYRCPGSGALSTLSVINNLNDPKEIRVAIDIKMSAPVDFSIVEDPMIQPTAIDANGDSLLVNIQYFDVMHGNIPGPKNGFYWLETPSE